MSEICAAELVYKNSIDSAKKYEADLASKIPYFYLYSDHLVIYPQHENSNRRIKVSDKSKLNLKAPKFQGKVSEAAIRSIKQRVTSWLKSIIVFNDQKANRFKTKKHYPVFITLTLSGKQNHSDNYIKRELLGQFVKKMQRSYNVENYFWRAEKQKNGNIHFHILIDKYISYKNLQKDWNHIQEIKGYLDEFKIRFSHNSPNSVDVRSARNVTNFVDYALKYMIKNDDDNKVDGRIWGMSDNLKNLKTYRDVISGNMNDLIDKALIDNAVRFYKGEFFTCVYFEKSFKDSALCNFLKIKSKSYYLKIYGELYQNEPTDPKQENEPIPPHEIPPEQLELDIEFPEVLPKIFDNLKINLN